MKHDLRTETNRVFLAALVAELRFLRRPVTRNFSAIYIRKMEQGQEFCSKIATATIQQIKICNRACEMNE